MRINNQGGNNDSNIDYNDKKNSLRISKYIIVGIVEKLKQ